MNNPFDYTPDRACEQAYRNLILRIDELGQSHNPEDVELYRELQEGKMLGVLVAEDATGERHLFYAFSGQLGKSGFHHPAFVGPVFDYLQPDGYFKSAEADITRQNTSILRFEKEHLATVRKEYNVAEEKLSKVLSDRKEEYRISKSQREAIRNRELPGEEERKSMIRQSQFEKAELRRLKKRLAEELQPFASRLQEATRRLDDMKRCRRHDSEKLQRWLFSNFHLLNARGESRSLMDIFAVTPLKVPPSGAGECCAPKLLQAAYQQGLRPVAMAEYWYGKPKRGEVRIAGNHYPACRGKCLPILAWMLQGLDIEPPLGDEYQTPGRAEPTILYENEWFCIVDKPAGMLSVSGKGDADSVQQWLLRRYGTEKGVKVAHRLDQDTSGLLVATFGHEAYKTMQSLFARRMVVKTYIAELDGNYKVKGLPQTGDIRLPLEPDWFDRPRQRVDFDSGKEADTNYYFVGIREGRSRVVFHPRTGRTHQLRVHAASEQGLGMPIAGDRLYGSRTGYSRLLLHAHRLRFTFPLDGKVHIFESPVPF